MSRPIWLWAHPRSRSTALERMMIERGDVAVWHEPLVTLWDAGWVPGLDGRPLRTVAEVLAHAAAHPGRVFAKDTTEYDYSAALDPALAAGITHTFVVREPAAAIASHVRIKPDASLSDIGYEHQWALFERVRGLGAAPVVVDADRLVVDPERVVAAYCSAVGLPYRPQALRWDAGHRPEWERTRRWHLDAGESTGFTAGPGRPVRLDGHLAGYLAHHRPYYERLLAHALPLPPPQEESE
jgi:hypothetical protein